jgi:hypothetical protein
MGDCFSVASLENLLVGDKEGSQSGALYRPLRGLNLYSQFFISRAAPVALLCRPNGLKDSVCAVDPFSFFSFSFCCLALQSGDE